VLLNRASSIVEADERLADAAAAAVSRSVALVPGSWLGDDPAQRRADFEAFLHKRLSAPRSFVEEAEDARTA
jgi:hypothetical protein